MSFSSDVKEELSARLDSARHCQIAEFAAIMGMSGRIRRASGKRMQIEMSTENEIARYKFIVLLEQIFDIDTGDIIYVSKSSRDTTIRIENQEYVAKILQTELPFDLSLEDKERAINDIVRKTKLARIDSGLASCGNDMKQFQELIMMKAKISKMNISLQNG